LIKYLFIPLEIGVARTEYLALERLRYVYYFKLILNTLSVPNSEDTHPLAKKASYSPDQNFTILPVNPDGSINVTLKSSDIVNVNIDQVSGYGTYGKVPVEVK